MKSFVVLLTVRRSARRVPKPDLLFLSLPDPTRFSFENHRVASNPKYRVILFYILLYIFLRLLSVLLCHMPQKLNRSYAWETALIAGVGILSSVSALVYFQIRRISARIVALVTLERSLSWMGTHVFFKGGSLWAGVVTLWTTERFFYRVCQHVSDEVTTSFARVVTFCAVKRFFSRMCQHVSPEVTRLFAGVVTLCATERVFSRMNP